MDLAVRIVADVDRRVPVGPDAESAQWSWTSRIVWELKARSCGRRGPATDVVDALALDLEDYRPHT